MGLLNCNSKQYKITWMDDQLFPNKKGIDILEDGKKIGVVKNVGFQGLKSKFSLFDNNGAVVLTAHKTRGGFSMSEYLDDENGEHLGIVSQPLRGKVVAQLKDNTNKTILSAFGNRNIDPYFELEEQYQINNIQETCIAKVILKIEKIPLEKKKFFKKNYTKHSSSLEIVDDECNRKVLVGFFTLILVHLYNYGGGEGSGG